MLQNVTLPPLVNGKMLFIEGLWVYYCGADGASKRTDRYLSTPLY